MLRESFKYITASKRDDKIIDGLKGITGEFPEAVDVIKPLFLRLGTTLFGDTARLILGNPAEDPDQFSRSHYSSIVC